VKRALLLSTTTGYQTRAFAEAADRQGIELMFATDRCDQLPNPWRDDAVPIRFHREAESVDALVAAARARPLDGLLVIGDRPVVIAARLAEALGLPGNAPEAARVSRDKQAMRDRFAAAGLPVPWYRTFNITGSQRAMGNEQWGEHGLRTSDSGRPDRTSDIGHRTSDGEARTPDVARLAAHVFYPCVLKPIALSASRGVIRANNPAEFTEAWHRIVRLLRSKDIQTLRDPATDVVQVEGYIEGREYAIEGLLDRGHLRVLAIFDKPDPLEGPFFEETIYVTPADLTTGEREAIERAIESAVAAIGLSHGPIHAECRVNARGVFVLEVAARPIGGLCARALRFTQGGSDPWVLEDLLLAHAVGRPIDGWRREDRASGVMMIPVPGRGTFRGVDGIAEAEAVPGVTSIEITAKLDQRLVPLPEGASYPGFIFARGTTAHAVTASLREAHGRLRFQVERELRVIT
jgi:biotin carboxylase